MIQRIQSLYLLIVAALMTTTLFAPLAKFMTDKAEFALNAFTLEDVATGVTQSIPPYLGILLVLTVIVPFVTMLLFKRRMLQIRLCAVNIVLLIGVVIFIAIYYYLNSILDGAEFTARSFSMAAIFPLLSLILTYLAARAIFKDEMLVRSLDRIR